MSKKQRRRYWGVRIGIVLAMMPIVGFVTMKFFFKEYLSPGPVSAMQRTGAEYGGYASHASFEMECKHCHAPVHCLTANRCQDCHHDVAEQRASGEGLHALLPGTDKCQTCHPEHNGREAVISQMAMANIDHLSLTGFSLAHHKENGDGTAIACEDCHTTGTFSAAGVDCVTCHNSAAVASLVGHEERFGSNCLLCHDGADRMMDFDHEQVYALNGAHVEAACETCHAAQVFAGTTRECSDCHEQPVRHAGLFGQDCARCHGAVAWAPAQLSEHAFGLDHGGAGSQPCTVCHETTLSEHRCDGCHEHQLAMVEEQHAAANVDIDAKEFCSECHRVGSEEELSQLRHTYQESRVPSEVVSSPQN